MGQELSERVELLWVSAIKERGWTDGSIKKFLGEPDEYRDNPHYRKGPQMRLYRMDRIAQAEESEEWQAWFKRVAARRAKQSKASTEAARRRREKLIESAVNEIELFREAIPTTWKGLINKAVKHYNRHQMNFRINRGVYDGFQSARASDSPEFLERIAGNLIRHEMSNYDWICHGLYGQVGREWAYQALRARVDELTDDVITDLREKAALTDRTSTEGDES